MIQPNTTAADAVSKRQARLLRLAKEQGIKPIESIDDLRGDFFPENESIDDFVATVRQWRDEGDTPRGSD